MTTHTPQDNRVYLVQDAASITNANLVVITGDGICPVLRISHFITHYSVSVWCNGFQIDLPCAWNTLVFDVDEAEFERLMQKHSTRPAQ